MTPIQRPKGQHYLPQLYLKRFSIPGGKNQPAIWTYNKMNDSVEAIGIGNVCKESSFHDVIDGEGNAKSLESNITENEVRLGKAYYAFCDDPTLEVLWSKFTDITTYIAFLIARSRRYRQVLHSFVAQVVEAQKGVGIESMWSGFDENDIKINHLNLIGEETDKIVQRLSQMKWVICINRTPRRFYTSDYPFAFEPITEERMRGQGLIIPSISWLLERKGMRMYFPVTPRVALIIGDPATHSHIPDTISLSLGDILTTVRTLNQTQVIWSERFVFSQENDFSLVKTMLKADESLRNPNKRRFNVSVSLKTGEAEGGSLAPSSMLIHTG
ncbi:MAG TPA: DUF4238 domain-containing protein [Chloroflexia bacterium]|nr:DUF4238 domain-containing protein [Chloroflexia bacterium]